MAAVTLITTTSLQARAETLQVDINGGADFISIQAAIDEAIEGDTIVIAPGTYAERIVMNAGGIELTSTDGPELTSIIGDGLAPLVLIQLAPEAPVIAISGLSLTNTGDSAIYVTSASLELDDVEISDSGAIDIDGGGVYAYQSILNLNNTVIKDSLGFNGGAIHLDNSSIMLTSCELSNNAGENGGGVYGKNESSFTDENSSFLYNSANTSGGGLYFDGPEDGLSPFMVNLSGSTVDGNSSGEYGGGIATYYTGQIQIDNSSISYNYADDDGGGIFAYYLYGELSISNSDISNNSGNNNKGGGIYAEKYVDLFIENSDINYNIADNSHGGGIYAYNRVQLYITESSISYNATERAGGGVFSQSGYDTHPAYIADSTLVGNVSYFEGGGAVIQNTETSEVYRNVFSKNSSGDDSPGGGLFIRETENFAVANNLFYGNDAGYGGGLALDNLDSTVGPYTLTNNIFQENIGAFGGGLFVQSGERPEGSAETGSYWGTESETHVVDFYVEETEEAISGDWVARIDYDYSLCTDEAYAVFKGTVVSDIYEEPTGGSIWINSSDPNAEIGVRLRDGEEEVFWYYIGTVLGTGWIQYNLSDYNSFPSSSNWSGNDDGIFDPPLTGVEMTIYANEGNSGSLQFDNVTLQFENAGPVVVADYEQLDFVVQGHNNTFVGNIGLNKGAGVAAANSAIDLTNNAFVSNSGANVIEYLDDESERTSVNMYNGWYDNTPQVEGLAGSGAVTEAPEWAYYERDATQANDNFTLLVDSPYVDAGMVDISDPTGSRSDIGSNGGPGAIWVDDDGDGYTTMNDCDDTDPEVHPGGDDSWYDGINGDCMSGSDYDQDGDGYDSIEFTPDELGTDCDDNDPEVTEDCGGEPSLDEPTDTGECGCTSGGTDGALWLGFLALAGLVQRRRV